MFNSVVLDVVIGLVFIYLLYSLLITILGEMAISWLGVRARILRKAVEKMLNDGYPENEKEGWDKFKYKIGQFFLQEAKEFPGSFAGKFYDQPSIKYLTRSQKYAPLLFKQSKPSYFSGRNFAETLVQLFRNAGAGKNDMERIRFCLEHNRLNLQPETLFQFKNLAHDSANDLEVFKTKLNQWFDETMDRANGWYKDKLRIILFLLGFFLAISFNIDSIKIASSLSKDKEARDQLVKMSMDFVKDSTNKNFVYIDGDTIYRDALYDSAYARVSKDVDDANHVLGLGWDFDHLTKPFSHCITKTHQKKDSFDLIRNESVRLKELKAEKKQIITRNASYQDSIRMINTLIAKEIRDTLNERYSMLMSEKDTSEKLTGLQKGIAKNTGRLRLLRMQSVSDSVSLKKLEKEERELSQALYRKTGKYFATIDSVNDVGCCQKQICFYGTRHYTSCETVHYFLHASFCPGEKSFWGFIITALALSLGAPFWFDLLKKLVSIRGVGIKPEEKPADPNVVSPVAGGGGMDGGGLLKSASGNPGPENKETPVDTALRLYGDEIGKEKGVVKVAHGFIKGKDDKVEDCIQINVEDQDTAVRIMGKFRELKVGATEIVPTNVVVTGKPVLKSNGIGNEELAIANKTLKHGWGSYGCIVESIFEPKKYILSCFHVMKGDNNWSSVGNLQEIIGYDNTSLSTQYTGYLTNELDIAYAAVDDGIVQEYLRKLPNPKAAALVTQSDVFKTKVTVHGSKSSGLVGTIVHHNWADDFEYPLDNGSVLKHRLEGLIVISVTDTTGQHAVSQVGDSGSVITDEAGNACGIVVAGDDRFTYAIKMTTILSTLGLKLA